MMSQLTIEQKLSICLEKVLLWMQKRDVFRVNCFSENGLIEFICMCSRKV